MHPAILGIAIGTQLLLTQVSDQVPKLDVASTCKSSVQADQQMSLDLPQTFEKCMADENAAEQQLTPIWSSSSASAQHQCYDEAVAAGTPSYVDLLVCLQMNDSMRTTPVTDLKGASKRKPAK